MRAKWCINNGTDDDKIIEWEKNVRYFWVTSIFYSHSGLIPSFLMRKNEKNQIPPTRDQKIVTLECMNPILNDGKAEGRGHFLNKGQPLRFFSTSLHSHFTVFSSFNTHSLSEMSVEWVRQSIPPQPPLQRGLGGMDWRTPSTLILLTEWEWNDAFTMEQITIELLNEKRMRDIFEWPRFFTPIPVSFLHFWWEKMRKIRSRLQGIRKLSLWNAWTQF